MTAAPQVIVLVFTGDSGLTHYSLSLARCLHEEGVSVQVLAGRSVAGEGFPAQPFPVLAYFRRSRWYPLDMLRLLWHLRRHPSAIVSVQSLLKSGWGEGLLFRGLRLLGQRCVMTVHDVQPHHPGRFSQASHRWLYGAFAGLVVHSQRAATTISAMGVSTPSSVVPHGLYDIFRVQVLPAAQWRRAYSSFDADDFVLLFFGYLDVRKGIGEFLQLIGDHAADPHLKFVIAGRNGLAAADPSAAAALVAARSDPRCLVMTEGVPFAEVQRYFEMADVVVMPYREGSTSGVLKLALAFGKPVVASDVGDLGEALSAGIGELVPADYCMAELRRAVAKVRGNWPSYAQRCAAVAEGYSWPRLASSYRTALGV